MLFQPVIMAAGPGSRMPDLVTGTPKALLPIANKPMVWYPVNMLQKAGFEEAIIIVTETHLDAIRKSLVEICQIKMTLDFVPIPDGKDWGTADSLRHIANKITMDMLIVSCDLITDVPLHKLADLHRIKQSTVTVLMGMMPETKGLQVPGGKAKMERDFVTLENETRLVGLCAEADLETSISFSRAFMRRHPNVTVNCGLLDAHMYLMKPWVLDFLKQEPTVSTIKGELLPKLVRRQFVKPQQDDKTKRISSMDSSDDDFDKFDLDKNDHAAISKTLSKLVKKMSTHPIEKKVTEIKCHALILDGGGFCLRSNDIIMYCESNRQIPRQLTIEDGDVAKYQSVHPTVKLTKSTKSTVGADSMVGEGSSIGERVAIKKSVIGRHCIIKDKVKITNSIIMDYSVVEEGSIITGSLICSQVEIGEKCELKDTVVAAGQKLNPMGKYTNESVIELTRMMAIE